MATNSDSARNWRNGVVRQECYFDQIRQIAEISEEEKQQVFDGLGKLREVFTDSITNRL